MEPNPDRLHFPLFDSLRAVAALLVVLVHVALLTGALGTWYGSYLAHFDIGVPFFFLLSGFLLYRPFVRARIAGEAHPSLRAYARNRFVRIAPAYWVALTIVAIVPGLAGIFSENWWVYYGLLQNYIGIYTPDAECLADPFRCGISPTWSLAVEVFFYALLPVLVLAMARWGRRGEGWLRVELGIMVMIAAISVLIQSSVPATGFDYFLFFSPLGRGWWFGLGLALAAISVAVEMGTSEPKIIEWIRRHGNLAPLAAITLYIVGTEFILADGPIFGFPLIDLSDYLFGYFFAGVIVALALLPAIFGTDGGGFYRRALGHPTLTWAGKISYGIFLWHFPILLGLIDLGLTDVSPSHSFVIVLAATLPATLVAASASFYLLERPLMRRYRSKSHKSGTNAGMKAGIS